ncbi:hypothetical protein V6N11_027051 [Hibiscus sabdariffa]|uniref:Myb/SANT-like domain-containing protein n=1 Tax=Hibiscus sabdariffa TaxID=183260 RepID=A0ABR2PFU1_9ROSI
MNLEENQIKNRYNVMKKDYGVVKTLLGHNGFGWDETRQMVVADDKVWDNYIAKHVPPRASAHKKRVCYDVGETIETAIYDMFSTVKLRALQLDASSERTLYQKCREELQHLEELDDAEFTNFINVLKDNKNAIAFMTTSAFDLVEGTGILPPKSTFQSRTEVNPVSFKIVNKCRHKKWSGLSSGANTPLLPTTDFLLNPGKSRTMTIPSADCGSGQIECSGSGAKPPATLAEFTLNGAGGLDFYDVSLVDGYNLPMLIVAKGGKGGNCSTTCFLLDLNDTCPSELRVARKDGGGVRCKSACEAFDDPQYYCSGAFGTLDVCRLFAYSFFKRACPRSYNYAYDDTTSTYTCVSADYVIIFCPPPYTSQELFGEQKDRATLPLVNKSMIYISNVHANGVSSSSLLRVQFTVFVASFVMVLFLFWIRMIPL